MSESAVQLEARRRFQEEQSAARAVALAAQQAREAEKLRLIEAQREDRIRREAEQIQARIRAEEAEREVRRLAEQEAFEQAVAEQVAALKKRPLEERMLAEVEDLRHLVSTLSGQLSSTLLTPPSSYGLDTLQSKVATLASSPWNSGIQEVTAELQKISSQLAAQNSQLTEIRALATRPARPVTIYASVVTLGIQQNSTQCNTPFFGVQSSPTGARKLVVAYNLISQLASGPSGAAQHLDIQENSAAVIQVPAGQKIWIVSAHWRPHNNTSTQVLADATNQLKSTGIENQ